MMNILYIYYNICLYYPLFKCFRAVQKCNSIIIYTIVIKYKYLININIFLYFNIVGSRKKTF